MNIYDNCKTMADRKVIDAELKARARPTMFYETSIIIPLAIPGARPMVCKTNPKPYKK
jgi:hypothetical protein